MCLVTLWTAKRWTTGRKAGSDPSRSDDWFRWNRNRYELGWSRAAKQTNNRVGYCSFIARRNPYHQLHVWSHDAIVLLDDSLWMSQVFFLSISYASCCNARKKRIECRVRDTCSPAYVRRVLNNIRPTDRPIFFSILILWSNRTIDCSSDIIFEFPLFFFFFFFRVRNFLRVSLFYFSFCKLYIALKIFDDSMKIVRRRTERVSTSIYIPER